MEMLKAFAEFKRSMEGKDPRAIVQGLLRSGKMTQAQYAELVQEAKALQSILK